MLGCSRLRRSSLLLDAAYILIILQLLLHHGYARSLASDTSSEIFKYEKIDSTEDIRNSLPDLQKYAEFNSSHNLVVSMKNGDEKREIHGTLLIPGDLIMDLQPSDSNAKGQMQLKLQILGGSLKYDIAWNQESRNVVVKGASTDPMEFVNIKELFINHAKDGKLSGYSVKKNGKIDLYPDEQTRPLESSVALEDKQLVNFTLSWEGLSSKFKLGFGKDIILVRSFFPFATTTELSNGTTTSEPSSSKALIGGIIGGILGILFLAAVICIVILVCRKKKSQKTVPLTAPKASSTSQLQKDETGESSAASTMPLSKRKPFVDNGLYDDLDPNKPPEAVKPVLKGKPEVVTPVPKEKLEASKPMSLQKTQSLMPELLKEESTQAVTPPPSVYAEAKKF